MSQPKTYNGKFNRTKSLIEQSNRMKSAVEEFAKATSDQDVFYSLRRLVYLEMKETLQKQGKSPKSAANMAFTLSGWLETELHPETCTGSWMYNKKYYQSMQNGLTELEFFAQQESDPHQSIRYTDGFITDKLGLDLRSNKEILVSVQQRLTA